MAVSDVRHSGSCMFQRSCFSSTVVLELQSSVRAMTDAEARWPKSESEVREQYVEEMRVDRWVRVDRWFRVDCRANTAPIRVERSV